MPTKRPPRDVNEFAKYLVDVTTGETDKIEPPVKNLHMQSLSAKGASKGGNARAKSLSASQRSAAAKKAAKARWKSQG